MSEQKLRALQRLARSSWGQQGTGACPRRVLRRWLQEQGYARSANRRGDECIMTLTLKGFKALHAEEWNRALAESPKKVGDA